MRQPSSKKTQQERNGNGLFPPTPVASKELSVRPDRPDTYRIPIKGGDPYFGLTRSWYYSAEQDGRLRLIRVRKRGKQRGVTLVPYDDVAAIIAAAKLG